MEEDAPIQHDETDSKPTDIQLLVSTISRQLEASQRREDRVVALLERICASEPRQPPDAPHRSGEDGGAEAATPARDRDPPIEPARNEAGTDSNPRDADGPVIRHSSEHDCPAERGPRPPPGADPAPAGARQGGGDLDRGNLDRGGTPGAGAVPAVAGQPGGGLDRSRAGPRLPAGGTPAPRLSASASLRDFEIWKSKFDGYSLLVGLPDLTLAEQRAALLALLDDDWSRTVRFGIPGSESASVQEIVAAMQQHLRRQRNVLLDRRDFDSRVQQEGESFDEYLCTLKEIAAFCDFCTACVDERLRDRIIVGVRSDEARRRMLEQNGLTLMAAADICRAAENAATSGAAIEGSTSSVLKMSAYRRQRDGGRFGGRTGGAISSDITTAPSAHTGSSDRCAGCGAPSHSERQRCPATGRTCFKCGKKDHFSSVCRSRGRSQSRRRLSSVRVCRSTSVPANQRLSDIRIRGITTRPSPRVHLQLHRPDGGIISTSWTPDTGAETSAMSSSFAKRMGLRQLQPATSRLVGADGKEMNCLGTCNVQLQLGEVAHSAEVAIVKQLNGPLLSWHDCISLGILPSTFPQQICLVAQQPVGSKSSPASVTEAVVDTIGQSARGKETSRPCELSNQQSTSGGNVRHPPVWNPRTGALPTAAERQEHMASMKSSFPKVFDISTLREMSGGEMKIELTDDAVPFAITAPRSIPFCWRDEVKKQLDDLQQKGIIEPVHHPTDWCHPLVPVPKRSTDGSVSGCRLTVDFTKLNKYVKRPIHPVRGTHDAVASIERGARFFTKMDSKSGYHQVPIRKEDQDLTTFLTPWGRFRYRRAVMGLTCSGDIYNQRGDQALGDIPRTCKVVDDVIVWDSDYNEHIKHVWKILQRCDDNGITLNGDKFIFGADRVDFCGYEISADGYSPDQKKTRAIAEFPQPGCLTDLRSFLGLVTQLGAFSSEVSAAAEPLRQLLRPRNTWIWTEDHTSAFNNVKKLLVAPPVLGFFDPERRTVLETDAARLKGLGFCLRQQDEHGHWRLIQCGSRFLSETESRYATIEVELLAITWAATKCSTYLKGMQNFEIITDHRPLVPMLNKKSLQDIENPRLQRLREMLTPFNFTATWRKGQQHHVPDALSRNPVDPPCSSDEDDTETLHVGSLILRIVADVDEDGERAVPFEDITLSALRAATGRDPEIQALKNAVMNGFPDHKSEVDNQIRPYWCMRDKLTIDDDLVLCGHRLVIPASIRRSVLQSLHSSHQGEERTKRRARQTVYWPGMDHDVTNIVRSCMQCRTHQMAQQKEPIIQERLPSRVFEAASADFFEYAGRTYLVYADRLSGWPFVTDMSHEATARNLVSALREMFSYTGVPVVLRTDGGPQFTAGITKKFLTKWGVQHQVSTPHYPQANGHAEAAVKAVKRLVKKTTSNGQLDCDAFAEGLLELRNSPRADGRSAAQVLYGHPLRSTVPAHHRAFAERWQKLADECDARAAEEKEKTAERYNSSAKPLNKIHMGQQVLIQQPRTGLWDRTGIISGIGRFRSFLIRLPSGRLCWRNRRFLRPVRPLIAENQPTLSQSQTHVTDQQHGQQSHQGQQTHRQMIPHQQPRRSPGLQSPGQDSPRLLQDQLHQQADQQDRPPRQPTPLQTDDDLQLQPEASPTVPDIRDSQPAAGGTPLRRSTRVRSRPERLQVQWGTRSYE